MTVSSAVLFPLLMVVLLSTCRTAIDMVDAQETCTTDRLLVGNTRGSSDIVSFQLSTMMGGSDIDPSSATPFITTGLVAPDQILYKDGYYYISTGDTVENSAIVRYTKDGEGPDPTWMASGGGMKRPYGFAFHDSTDTLYVASFMTDQILSYNATTGEYIGVFAQGDATEEGLCNGPNEMDIHDDKIYMTTQGSYIDEAGELQYAFASQVVMYDLLTGEGSVYIPQPDPDPNGLGFISMLAIKIGCGEASLLEDDCTVYTTDFAGGLRIYSYTDPQLLDAQSTTYADGAATGSIALGPDGTMYIPAFASDDSGVIMSFLSLAGESPTPFNETTLEVLYGPEGLLARPIGIYFDECVMDMGSTPPVDSPTMEAPVAAVTTPPTAAPTPADETTTTAPSGALDSPLKSAWSMGGTLITIGLCLGFAMIL